VPHPKDTPKELEEKILKEAPQEIVIDPERNSSYLLAGDKSRYEKTHSKSQVQNYKWWSPETRIKAVTLYLLYGNSERVGKALGMPSATIRRWKMEPWWAELVHRVRLEGNDKLDSQISKTIQKAMQEVEDRLENGEYVYDGRRGEMVRVPVKTTDAVRVVGTLFDKRALLRGEPTKRVEQTNINDKLKQMAEQFAKFAKTKEIKGESKTISINSSGSSPESGEHSEAQGKFDEKQVSTS
jgi:hypothetical protein